MVGSGNKHCTEYSQTNHFMFWRLKGNNNKKAQDWKPPTENIRKSVRLEAFL